MPLQGAPIGVAGSGGVRLLGDVDRVGEHAGVEGARDGAVRGAAPFIGMPAVWPFLLIIRFMGVQIVSIQHPQRPVLWMKLYHAKVYENIHGARGGGRLLR